MTPSCRRVMPTLSRVLAGWLLTAAPAVAQPGAGSLPFGFETALRAMGDQYAAVSSADFGLALAKDGDTLAVGTRGSVCVFVRAGSGWLLQQTLTDLPPTGSHFGEKIALSGDTLVVGAAYTDVGGLGGAAYVYVRAGGVWTLQQTLAGNGAALFSEFGASVAIEGDTLLVGAPSEPSAAGEIFEGAVHVFARTGSVWLEVQRLEPPEDMGGYFGRAVALSGDTAAIGISFEAPSEAGAAFVFTRSGSAWTLQQILEPSDGAADDGFGSAVDVDGDRVVVGATRHGVGDTGAAYVFTRSGAVWTQQQKLTGVLPSSSDRCGTRVAIEDDTILMACINREAYAFAWSGATWARQTLLGTLGETPGDSVALDGDEAFVGAWFVETGIPPLQTIGPDIVTLFTRAAGAWAATSRLYNPDSTFSDSFGTSVAASGDLVAVGAPYDATSSAPTTGSVSVFARAAGVWTRQVKMAPASLTPGARLGMSVALQGTRLVAGAAGSATTTGSALVFEGGGGTWTPTATLTPTDGQPGGEFGTAVALSANTVVVGASRGGPAGAAYVFVAGAVSWSEQAKLVPPDGAVGDLFGQAVAVSGDTIVVGSYATTPGLTRAGAAYVYARSGTAWSFVQKLTAFDAEPGAHFGSSLALAGDEILVGAPLTDGPSAPNVGAVYRFVRSGASWAFAQKLTAAGTGSFGQALALDGDRLAVGADETDLGSPISFPEGTVHVFERAGAWVETQQLAVPSSPFFGASVALDAPVLVAGAGIQGSQIAGVFRQGPATDLAVALSAPPSAMAGTPMALSLTVTNQGSAGVAGAPVDALLPPPLGSVTWTCAASPGSACAASGSGSIADTVAIAPGGSLAYAITAQVRPDALAAISTTAKVAPPPGLLDTDPADNTSSATIAVTRSAELSIDKTDGRVRVAPGAPLSYTLTVRNAGPSRAQVSVNDVFPAAYGGVTWTCAAETGSHCSVPAGSGSIFTAHGVLQPGHSLAFTTSGTVSPGATGTLANTATIGAETGLDPDASNDSDTDLDLISLAAAELTPGSSATQSFAIAGPHHFWILQKPYASYEVVVDAVVGQAGPAPALDRLGSGTTVIQTSTGASGIGFARSLRFRNDRPIEVDHELVRVTSAACSTGCGAGDGYRVRAYETTGRIARFNNSGSQGSVVVLQNTDAMPVSGTVYFWGPDGALRARTNVTLAARAMTVVGTGGIAELQGTSGSITVAHDGPYGALVGKAVSLEPSTGFSFDSPLEPVPR